MFASFVPLRWERKLVNSFVTGLHMEIYIYVYIYVYKYIFGCIQVPNLLNWPKLSVIPLFCLVKNGIPTIDDDHPLMLHHIHRIYRVVWPLPITPTTVLKLSVSIPNYCLACILNVSRVSLEFHYIFPWPIYGITVYYRIRIIFPYSFPIPNLQGAASRMLMLDVSVQDQHKCKLAINTLLSFFFECPNNS